MNADVMYWIFDNYWLPPFRAFISSKFSVRQDSKTLLNALLQWKHLFPDRFFDKLCESYIKPKLKREIDENWNPKDTSTESNLI
jgi:hypothetical protein